MRKRRKGLRGKPLKQKNQIFCKELLILKKYLG
jgi:hypothetical protein